MTFEYLNCWNLIISRTKGDFKMTLKTFFLISQVLSFRHTKQTSKNVMGTTYCTIYSPLLIKTALTQPCKRKLMIKTFLIYHICPFSMCLNSISTTSTAAAHVTSMHGEGEVGFALQPHWNWFTWPMLCANKSCLKPY